MTPPITWEEDLLRAQALLRTFYDATQARKLNTAEVALNDAINALERARVNFIHRRYYEELPMKY